MDFFAPRGEFQVAGLFSSGHLFMLACCLLALVILIYWTIKKPAEKPYWLIRIISVLVLVL